MAYNAELLERLRCRLADRPGFEQKNMFGGQALMIGGHMACGVLNDRLIVRIGPQATAEALRGPHTRPMDFTGKVMKAYTVVETEGLKTEEQLDRWVQQALDFVATLPAK
jgi:TfoX/Sxy family transcriptional regulator of competence genes